VSDLATWIGVGVGALAILAALSRTAVAAWRVNRRIGRFLDDWFGDAADGLPSMPIRVARLEARSARIERHVFQAVPPPEQQ